MTELVNNIPRHVAIIMDGNGRWAQLRGLERVDGHKAGASALQNAVKAAAEIGIEHLSVYAFSTENWQRPKAEVTALFKLLVDYCYNQVAELIENNVIIKFIGDIASMPLAERQAMRQAENRTAKCTGLQVNVFINYGARQEIIKAVQDVIKQGIELKNIDEQTFSQQLYTATIPDPDLIIRTSGEQRLSNFMLWQASYAEFVFTEQYWPDFNKESLLECIRIYQGRKRRYGSI